MLGGILEDEHHRHLRIETAGAQLNEVASGVEVKPVNADGKIALRELSNSTIAVGYRSAQNQPAPVGSPMAEGDRDSRGRPAARGVEHMCRDGHPLSIHPRRSRMILRCSPAATLTSVSGSLLKRC